MIALTMPRRARTLVALTVLVIASGVAGRNARADLAPPDMCTAPGQPCLNAPPTYNVSGTCVATTCTRNVPTDGGMMSMTYDCNRCKAPSDGGGGSGGASGTGGAGGGTDAANDGKGTKENSGCSIAPGADRLTDGLATLALAAGFGAAARRRRQSQRRP